ncbi:furin-like protease kpc-1 isoform X1 [Lycorma delicatula]|uniref:furin-like protease kpc-1 isoform X1 n=1 Tax=Lycorma delicatula TaxID=130591 RepID=UPI003F51370E
MNTVRVALLLGLVAWASSRHYSSQWAAHIEGGPKVAQEIASRHGFTFLGEIFPDCYHLQHPGVARRSVNPSPEYHENLLSETQVKWARQQKVISRYKRDYFGSQFLYPLNDPKWPQMWYLNRGAGLDMSVQGAWREGITGRGVVVTILDDGLEKDHPDLIKNYDPQASYDVNNHDDDPMPRYDLIDSNRHGTRCAGEVAAVANNSLCAVGIAFNANIGGVRMLDGDVTDAVEARSLSLNPQHIDIYSASWGPDDDGKTVDGPGELAMRAFIEGVTKGREGKGSIFVWASGNGGRDLDNCNCDGYTNSIWTLSISSATEKGQVPWYSEACSSTLATTYSSGSNGEKQVITTDLHHKCTVSHTGTSASAPLAAGICALALEANRQLTWRDMQHIVVATAKPANLKASDWTTNGVGRNVSHSFGYGLMDAEAMVKLARKWRTVPEQHKCEVVAPHTDKLIPAKSTVTLSIRVKECRGVNYLEHVQAKITLNSQKRGDLQIHLTSPAGTRSTLLARRPHDGSRIGFQSWPFMSVHTWGESPFGTWQLEIHNEGRFLGRANLLEWTLIFYGTETPPGYHPTQVNPQPPYPVNLPPPPRKNKNSRKNKSANITPKPNWKSGSKDIKQSQASQKKASGGKNSKVIPTFAPNISQKTGRPSVISPRRPTTAPQTNTKVKATIFTHPQLQSEKQQQTTITTAASTVTATTFSATTASENPNAVTHAVGLTILLAPPPQPSPVFPAIFKKYPKVQQLFPYPHLHEGPPRPSKKGLDGHDDITDPKDIPGKLIDWNLIFYGTEIAPMSFEKGNTSKSIPEKSSDKVLKKEQRISSTTVSPTRQGSTNWRDDVAQHSGLELSQTSGANSVLCRRSTNSCIECSNGLHLFNGECLAVCPDGTYSSSGHCLQCYYMCKTCSGPNDYECVTCHKDSILINTGIESFCCPQSLLPSIDFTTWYYRACIGLVINISLLISVGICLIAQAQGCRILSTRRLSSRASKSKLPSDEKALKYNLTLNFDQSDSDDC